MYALKATASPQMAVGVRETMRRILVTLIIVIALTVNVLFWAQVSIKGLGGAIRLGH